MKTKLTALAFGIGFGFVVAWARLSDPDVIRDMLLLREMHVFLLMGSTVLVAAVGVRLLRAARVRALLTSEPIGWELAAPKARHVVGSALFGLGWGIAGTCPGPAAVMIGEGRLAGLFVAAGLLGGILLQPRFGRRSIAARAALPELRGAPGL